MSILRSKYPYSSTTIYNVTASLTPNFRDLTIMQRIEAARPLVFSFEYPTPNNIQPEVFKEYFERLFITRFIDDYFKAETFEKWQVKLYSKMLEVLPVYNEILSGFFYKDKDKLLLNTSKTTTTGNSTGKTESENESESESESESKSKGNTTVKNKDIKANFPGSLRTAGTNVDNVHYANNGDVFNGDTNNTNSGTNSGTNTTTGSNKTETENEYETITESKSGNILDGIIKFNNEYKNIFTKLINEFNPLFSAIIHY